GVPDPDPLDHRLLVGLRLISTHAGPTGVSGRSLRPVVPIWISVSMPGQTPQSKHGVQRQSSCSYPVSASCQSFQSQSLSSPDSRWSQGSTSSSSRSRVVYQSRSTPTSTQAWVHREKEKCSDHPSTRPPSSHTRRITAPTRRSPLDSSPSMSEGCPSWYRYPMARPSDRSELIACFKRCSRWSMVSGELIAAHWK